MKYDIGPIRFGSVLYKNLYSAMTSRKNIP